MRAIALLFLTTVLGCGGGKPDRNAPPDEEVPVARTINEVLSAHNDSLMRLPGVVGTAIGLCDSTRCIRVLVADSSEATRRSIPTQLEGYQVRVEVTGTVRPR